MATAMATKTKETEKSRTKRHKERQIEIAAQLEEAGELVPSINQEHKAVVETLEKGLDHALKAGEHLSQAKKLVGHGGWAEWVKTHCEFSYRTARSYIRVYNRRNNLPQREEISYRRALLMLRADPTKKSGMKKKKIVRTIGLAELKKLLTRHKIGTEIDALLPLLENLGIRVTSPKV